MFAARDDHILFFDAADDADYGFAVVGARPGARRRRRHDRSADQDDRLGSTGSGRTGRRRGRTTTRRCAGAGSAPARLSHRRTRRSPSLDTRAGPRLGAWRSTDARHPARHSRPRSHGRARLPRRHAARRARRRRRQGRAAGRRSGAPATAVLGRRSTIRERSLAVARAQRIEARHHARPRARRGPRAVPPPRRAGRRRARDRCAGRARGAGLGWDDAARAAIHASSCARSRRSDRPVRTPAGAARTSRCSP